MAMHHQIVNRFLSRRGYLEGGSPEERAEMLDMLQEVLGALRALYWSHQTSHWVSKGDPYYGDHLLFQRLYESTEDSIDTLAEKMVGYFGEASVQACPAMEKAYSHLAEWYEQVPTCMYNRALFAEQQLQELLSEVYEGIKDLDLMTLGLDDFIMALANLHETNVYLLQQRLQGHKNRPPIPAAPVASEQHALTNLERTWGGYSTFDPRRHAEEVEEEG